MPISNIQATKYFDEVRAHFAPQAKVGVAIELEVRVVPGNGTSILIEIFDVNNTEALPLRLMSNEIGTGRNWSNEVGSGEIFYIVNQALLAFTMKKMEWARGNYEFTQKEGTDFLIQFMKQVSSFLR